MKNNLFFSAAMLTGKTAEHLQPLPCPFSDQHRLQADANNAFQALQQYALTFGFNLQPASSFRDFQRQQNIWNDKFNGKRKVHNDQGEAIDLCHLSDWQKCQAILRWSALPGASRHHWGSEIDVFDPDLLPAKQKLQLEPWEYEQGGYFAELSDFLQQNLAKFDFSLPFYPTNGAKNIGKEPWHISYLPVAQIAQSLFTPDILIAAWQGENIAGKDCLLEHLEQIFQDFMP